MFARGLWCFRVLYVLTGLAQESSRAMVMLYGEEIDRGLFVRFMVKVNPLLSVCSLTGCLIFIFGYIIMIFERKADPAFESYGTAMWLAIITCQSRRSIAWRFNLTL
jgi:hypothetical protein